MITGQKRTPADYHEKIDYERVNNYIKCRVLLYIQDHHQLNILTSITCLVDLKSLLLTDGLSIIFIRNGLD